MGRMVEFRRDPEDEVRDSFATRPLLVPDLELESNQGLTQAMAWLLEPMVHGRLIAIFRSVLVAMESPGGGSSAY